MRGSRGRPGPPPAVARALRLALVVAATTAGAGCAAVDELAASTASGSGAPLAPAAPAPPPGSRPDRVGPLQDRRGVHPGLTPVAAAQRGAARRLIARLPVGRPGPRAGYDRERGFGSAWKDDVDTTWGHDGCRTREQILHRDMKGIEFRAGTEECVVLIGLLQDPYTGRTIEFSKARPSEVQVDHVVPLSYAWAQGAHRWSQGRREQLAGDPLNLLAVDGPANQAKSDSGPAAWTPPNARVRCAYAVRFALVARRYRLPVTAGDRRAMQRACGEPPG